LIAGSAIDDADTGSRYLKIRQTHFPIISCREKLITKVDGEAKLGGVSADRDWIGITDTSTAVNYEKNFL